MNKLAYERFVDCSISYVVLSCREGGLGRVAEGIVSVATEAKERVVVNLK